MANHPHNNLVTFLGFYPKGRLLLMEYAAGGSLWNLLKNTTQDISWQNRYQIALDVAEGLSYLHDRGTVHGDLKGENILLDSNGRAKLTDFGTSKLKSEKSTHGTWGGTYHWAAPETFLTEKNSPASDVYSYGMVLWQLGARKEPFPGLSIGQLAKDIPAGKREKISDDTPIEIRKVIEWCWIAEPNSEEEVVIQRRPTIKRVRYLLEEGHPTFVEKEKEKKKLRERLEEEKKEELLNQLERLSKEKNELEIKLKRSYEEKKEELEVELKRLSKEKKELEIKLKRSDEEKKELLNRLERLSETEELLDQLERVSKEKNELEIKLKRSYEEKNELEIKLKRSYEGNGNGNGNGTYKRNGNGTTIRPLVLGSVCVVGGFVVVVGMYHYWSPGNK